ncbi:SAM-dependent methyltransferase [Thermocatellispora tengchongensis]|uniref:SAM-dependent methyltransferase n=1 Tax=Thermocatellispora tengchongensis TaxID=1073253 RepID=A0A840P469_9ACTN|nr:class I SAM-dependent methyltransferase [Thermocatellispora tengchongensis]MBB5132661.1 SAM-dependent methyltransferase [Thermocatellispora tengchongensis]
MTVRHPLFARLYPRASDYEDAHGALEHRRELLAEASGRVLEIGAGHGANFRHYPPTVHEVIAIEPEPRLRALAEDAATHAPIPVRVREGLAEHLPLPDDSVDAVVASQVLCSVRDVPRSLAEAARVLRPGGHLYFYEHIRSSRPAFARMQRALDLIWPLQGAGCHLARDTEQSITKAGFTIIRARHFDFLINGRTRPNSPCVIGKATLR